MNLKSKIALAALALTAALDARQAKPHGRLFPPQDLGLLEAPDRDRWQRPDRIMDALGIADASRVADVGAGSGWFTIRLARRVGPQGVVYAEDVQQEMLNAITRRVQREGLANVRTILGRGADTRLPSATFDAVLIVDAYHDGEGQALCPAATGISHHINPWGDIEPCPIVQFSKESIHATEEDPRPLREKFLRSTFLRDFRDLAARTTRGCIVLERPDLLGKLVEAHQARDVTARKTALAELRAQTVRTSQYNPTAAVPEKNPFYRLAKRLFFNDFGVYAGHDHSRTAAPGVLAAACRDSSALSGVETVVITLVARLVAHWVRIRPTPPAPACTSTVSPCWIG